MFLWYNCIIPIMISKEIQRYNWYNQLYQEKSPPKSEVSYSEFCKTQSLGMPMAAFIFITTKVKG